MRAARRPFHPRFLRAVRDSDYTRVALAALAGFPSHAHLGKALNGVLSQTPLTRSRLNALAAALHYEGPIFREEQP
jgi:hypothetical protein